MTLAFAYFTWRTGRAVPLVAALVMAIILGVSFLYLKQTSRLRWRWRITLLALRITALCALAVSLLQPAVLRVARPEDQGAIVLIVDHSHSMGTHDRQRQPGQLVALADGLGLISPTLRLKSDEWRTAAAELTLRMADLSDAQSRLAFARISGMSTHDAEMDVASAVARIEAAEEAIQHRSPAPVPGSPLAQALAKLHEAITMPHGLDVGETWLPVVQTAVEDVTAAADSSQLYNDARLYTTDAQVKEVCDALAAKSRLEVVEQALTHPKSGLLYHLPQGAPLYGYAAGDTLTPLPLQADGGEPVHRLLISPDGGATNPSIAVRDAIDQLRGTPVRAVILFSDGRQPPSAAPGISGTGVPVFAVCAAPLPGPREPAVKDLSITMSPLPDSIHPGETFTVNGKVLATGFAQGRQQAVECDFGAAKPLTKTITLARGRETDVAFDIHIDRPGSQRVTLRLPDVSGEITSENNVAQRWIKVLPAKTSIALVTDAPTWDWRVACDAFSFAPGFNVHTLVTDLHASSPLPPADVVILFNARAASLSQPQWMELERFVKERAGLLVLTGGAEYSLEDLNVPAVANLLPFALPPAPTTSLARPRSTDWKTWNGSSPEYHFEPFDASLSDRMTWTALPPLFHYLPLPSPADGAQPWLVESLTQTPVAAQKPLGTGHVVFIGLDEIWRWRYGLDQAGERFWTSLVQRWQEPEYAIGDNDFALDIEHAAIGPRDAINIRAKVSPSATPYSIQWRILQTDREIRRGEMAKITPARFASRLEALPVGEYMIEATLVRGDQSRVLRYPLHVAEPSGNQLENPVFGKETLQRIADNSGGHLLTLEQLRQLPPMLAGAADVRFVPFRLWDSGYLFVFVVASFCLEWALRKRLGLA